MMQKEFVSNIYIAAHELIYPRTYQTLKINKEGDFWYKWPKICMHILLN
jgi:hypothetical protein